MAEGSVTKLAEFELEKYRTDRAHELELNKFSHALEVERLKILQLLNGGAFTVVLGFSDTLVQTAGRPRDFALVSITSWVLGLMSAAWAAQLALNTQVRFSQAYHNRRRALEWRALLAIHSDRRLIARLSTPIPKGQTLPPEQYFAQQADTARGEGADFSLSVKRWAMASLLLFSLGAGLMIAALSMTTSSAPQRETPSVSFG